MNFEDSVIVALIVSNSIWVTYALVLRSKNFELKARLFERVQWNWAQQKQFWRN